MKRAQMDTQKEEVEGVKADDLKEAKKKVETKKEK